MSMISYGVDLECCSDIKYATQPSLKMNITLNRSKNCVTCFILLNGRWQNMLELGLNAGKLWETEEVIVRKNEK